MRLVLLGLVTLVALTAMAPSAQACFNPPPVCMEMELGLVGVGVKPYCPPACDGSTYVRIGELTIEVPT